MFLFDGFRPFFELLQVVDFKLNIGFINGYDFLIKFFNFSLEIFDLFVHSFNVLLSLPKVLPPLVLLLLEMLLQEAEITSPFVVNFFATAFTAD